MHNIYFIVFFVSVNFKFSGDKYCEETNLSHSLLPLVTVGCQVLVANEINVDVIN